MLKKCFQEFPKNFPYYALQCSHYACIISNISNNYLGTFQLVNALLEYFLGSINPRLGANAKQAKVVAEIFYKYRWTHLPIISKTPFIQLITSCGMPQFLDVLSCIVDVS